VTVCAFPLGNRGSTMSESDAITLLVPFPPGGSTDFTARLLAERLTQARGWRVEVETRTGDLGYNAVRALVAGSADRVFLVGNINASSVAPVVRRGEVDIDHWRVVRPVTKLADFPSVVCTHRSFSADTLDDFLSRLNETTGVIRYGTDFLGTYVDVDVIRLSERSGLDRACLTADGALAILADLEAERTDLAMLNVATATTNAARLKPLAISGSSRLKSFPGVPTLAEAGYAGIGTSNWQALLASRSAAEDRVAAVHGAVVEAMSGAESAERFAAVGATVSLSPSPGQLEVEIEAEAAEWEKYAPAIAGTKLLAR
jgi:tripartite-type tricarboxylate transporter receptor subunit TctC